MYIDNFYFVVSDLEKSINFYSNLLDESPTNVIEKRWADWGNEDNKVYFGIISKHAIEEKCKLGNNGVLGLYTNDINQSYNKCKELGAKIICEITEHPNSADHYKYFQIEDLDANRIEISYYDKY